MLTEGCRDNNLTIFRLCPQPDGNRCTADGLTSRMPASAEWLKGAGGIQVYFCSLRVMRALPSPALNSVGRFPPGWLPAQILSVSPLRSKMPATD